MIGRKSTNQLAKLCLSMFSGRESYTLGSGYQRQTAYRRVLKLRELEEFLYTSDYDAWFISQIKKINRTATEKFIDFIRGLHTGQPVVSALPDGNDWTKARSIGQTYLVKLCHDVIGRYYNLPEESHSTRVSYWADDTRKDLQLLMRQLEIDGYVYSEKRLYKSSQEPVNVDEEQSIVVKLAQDLALAKSQIIEHHVKLSESGYLEGRWGNSISDSRNFLEAVLQELASKHHLTKHGTPLDDKTYETATLVRKYFEDAGLLDRKETEAIRTTYGILSDTGGHPNLTDQDQARLMRNLALTLSQYVLLRVGKSL
jgi:hypothetical protein